MIKLKKVEPKYKNKFVVHIAIEHGDCDKSEYVKTIVNTEDKLIKIKKALENRPSPSSHGGDEKEYNDWCDTNFGERTIPDDLIYNNIRATVSVYGHRYYYYNEEGVEFEVEF